MNRQLVFGVMTVIFATALIASLVVDNANANQSISQKNRADQSSRISTGGAGSTVTGSGSNTATQTNTNNGGNARSG